MRQLSWFAIFLFFISINHFANAETSSYTKEKKMTKNSKKNNISKKRLYKKTRSGLDLVKLTTNSPYEDKINFPKNGVNKIENESGL